MADVWEILHPILSGVMASLVVGVLALPRPARKDTAGWKKIAPGSLHWVGLAIALFAAAFMSIMLIKNPIGAEDFQRDWENMAWFYVVFVGFWASTVFMALVIRRIRKADVEWLGEQIAFNQPNGPARFCLMTQVAEIHPTASGQVHVIFFDGSILKLDEHSKGANELCQAIINANENDDDDGGWPQAVPAHPSVREGIAH